MEQDSLQNRPNIIERTPDPGVISWRYIGESPDDYGWPNYGNLIPSDEYLEDSNKQE